jgi:hypothetical protein
MKVLTTVGMQYAIKVSYSKDKVPICQVRNCYLSSVSIIMVQLRKMSMRQLILKFYLQGSVLEFKTLVLKILMVYGGLLA